MRAISEASAKRHARLPEPIRTARPVAASRSRQPAQRAPSARRSGSWSRWRRECGMRQVAREGRGLPSRRSAGSTDPRPRPGPSGNGNPPTASARSVSNTTLELTKNITGSAAGLTANSQQVCLIQPLAGVVGGHEVSDTRGLNAVSVRRVDRTVGIRVPDIVSLGPWSRNALFSETDQSESRIRRPETRGASSGFAPCGSAFQPCVTAPLLCRPRRLPDFSPYS